MKYPIDENGLMIAENVPFDMSHRHYSHLFPIFPLYLMNCEQEENREVIKKSLDNWTSRREYFEGYSYTGASSICSSIGRKDEAVQFLNEFLSCKIEPNTLYKEWGPCIETPLSAAKSILDILIQSWGDKIRIFHGVPDSWKDVSIYNLRCEGGFLVSAVKKDGEIQLVEIKSTVEGKCKIIITDEVLEFDMKENETIRVSFESYKGDFSPVKAEEENCNYFGSKSMTQCNVIYKMNNIKQKRLCI